MESDLAFPETQKLIQIAKLYHCSIDYLLSHEADSIVDETINQQPKSDAMDEQKGFTNRHFSIIWTGAYFLLILLFYAFPFLKLTVTIPGGGFIFPDQSYDVSVNIYDLLAHGPTELGNFLVFIGLFTTLGIFVLGLLIYFSQKPDGMIKTRKILAIVEVSIWTLMFILFITNTRFSALMIPLLTGAHLVGLYKFKQLNELE